MLFIIVALIALAVASYTDFRTREVPDYLNYGLIFFGFGARLMFSIAYADWTYIIEGIVGFIVCLIVALIMFYMGQWGGGDAKMLMGLGATVGLTINLNTLLLRFLVNIVLIGALYGLVYSIILAAANWKPFLKGLKELLAQKGLRIVRRIVYALILVLLLAVFFVHDSILKILLLVLIFMVPLTMYVWLFVKVIEKVVMLKYVTPDKITEGDWIAKKVTVQGKYICGPKDLGIEKKQIKKLIEYYKHGKIKKVLVKYGIPFVPSFLIAFIVSIIGFNPILLFL